MELHHPASRVCREVVIRQPTEGIYAYKVNFKMAVMLCKEHLRTPNADGEALLKEIARTLSHSDICICSGFVPDRSKLCELAEQYDGVLVIFENISDELTML